MVVFDDISEVVVRSQVLSPPNERRLYEDLLAAAKRWLPLQSRLRTPVLIQAKEAGPRVREWHGALERAADRIVARMSAGEWLWYLRRVLDSFDLNDLVTTDPYCQLLAESLTLRSTRRSPPLPHRGTVTLDLSESRLRRVSQLRQVTALLYEIQGTFRWIGKGSPVRFVPAGLPEPEPTDELRDAVELYDQRSARSKLTPLARAGLHRTIRLDDVRSATREHMIPFTFRLDRPADIPLPLAAGGAPATVHGRYLLGMVDLDQITVLSDTSLPVELRWPERLADVAALLMTCLSAPFFARGMITHAKRGYRVVDEPTLLRELEAATELLASQRLGGLLPEDRLPGGSAETLASLERLAGSIWPPIQGSPIRRLNGGRWVLVDLDGASRLLFELLRGPHAASGNVRDWTGHFEGHVQAIIDKSPQRPARDLAALRGRTLRIGGNAVTDIDALGAREHELLLISCKSVPYTIEYDRGEYGTIRNIRTRVLNDLVEWEQRVERLRTTPHGDNYDFRAFRRITAIVVLPFVPFMEVGKATAEVLPGLRAVISSRELEEWLGGSRSPVSFAVAT